jgi:hypothetical protein
MLLNPPPLPPGAAGANQPQTWTIDTPERLFEYFLMDVQMDPCMETSRVRHALSAVQLFVDRALMNLEPGVTLSDDDAKRWTWMKRYRLWQANREVFLWPENWLDPGLRDDATPLFQQALSKLTQGDVTEDAAAEAMLDYLAGLEVLAKLEPCGIYWDENPPGGAGPTAHVIGRTSGAQRKYYYRRCESGFWTPWEKVDVDIEDNPVLPVLWRGRLLLFWLKIVASPSTAAGAPTGSTLGELVTSVNQGTATRSDYSAILCFSEYHNGKWQPPKTSGAGLPAGVPGAAPDPARPLWLGTCAPSEFNRAQIGIKQSLERIGPVEADVLAITLLNVPGSDRQGVPPPSWVLLNTHSGPFPLSQPVVGSADAVTINVVEPNGEDVDVYALTWSDLDDEREIVRFALTTSAPGFVQPQHPLQESWIAPFFYWDGRHAFYVTTTASPTIEANVHVDVPIEYDPVRSAGVLHDRAPIAVDKGPIGPGDGARSLLGTNIRFVLPGTDRVTFGLTDVGPLGSARAAPSLVIRGGATHLVMTSVLGGAR